MTFDSSLLNPQQYKVRIKGKVEQSRERSSALPLQRGVEVIEKGAFGSFQTIQFRRTTEFNCQKYFYFKLFSLVKQFFFKQFSLA